MISGRNAARRLGRLLAAGVLICLATGCERYPAGTRDITSQLRTGLERNERYTLASSDGRAISCVCVFDWEDNPPHDRANEIVDDLRNACAGRRDGSTGRFYSPFSMPHRHVAFVLFKDASQGDDFEYQIAEREGPLVAVTVLHAAGCFRGSRATIYARGGRSWEVKP
jgi:hypothetical protein